MYMVFPSIEFMNYESYEDLLSKIMYAFTSIDYNDFDVNKSFVKNKIRVGNDDILKHNTITLAITSDMETISKFSNYYINDNENISIQKIEYTKENITEDNVEFITPLTMYPSGCPEEIMEEYFKWCYESEKKYFDMIKNGVSKDKAKYILPISLSTNIIVTADIKSWRYMIKYGISKDVYLNSQHLFTMIQKLFLKNYKECFEDLPHNEVYWNTMA